MFPFFHFKNKKLFEWVLLLAFAGLLAFFLIFYQKSEKERILQEEEARMEAQLKIFEQGLLFGLKDVQEALGYVQMKYQEARQKKTGLALLNQELGMSVRLLSGVTEFMVTDQKGVGVAASSPMLLGMDISFRDYFKKASKDRIKGTHLTPPYMSVFNQMTLSLIRDVNDERGDFLGLVIAGLDDRFFGSLLSLLNYEEDMKTFFGRGEQLFLASYGYSGYFSQTAAPMPDEWMHYLRARQNAAIETPDRLLVLRVIKPENLPSLDTPLFIASLREKTQILASWRQNSLVYSAVFLSLLVASILSLLVLQKQHQVMGHNLQYQEEEKDSILERLSMLAERYKEAQHLANIGSWSLDLTTQKATWSDELYRIFGLHPAYDQPAHPVFMELVHPEDRQKIEEALHYSLTSFDIAKLSYRIVLRTGKTLVLESRWKSNYQDGKKATYVCGTVQDVTDWASGRF